MKKLKKYNLGFFLTKGVSLCLWDKLGILSREIKLYNLLAEYFNKIYFFTYGGKEELNYKKYLASNIEIIYKKIGLNNTIYSYLLPFLNFFYIRQCDFIKSNQALGIESLLLSKLFVNRRTKFIFRTGYTLSLTLKREKINSPFLDFLEKAAYKYCDMAIISSRSDQDYLFSRYKINQEKLRVIMNSVDVNAFCPQSSCQKYDNKVVSVGRLSPEKNLLNLIKAIEGTKVKLDIIGEGPLEDSMKKLAKEKRVEVNFLGTVKNENLPDVLNKYQVFVLPSFYEGMPKALLEAMACGLACIGSDIENIREIIKHKQTGILVKTNPKSIREGILELFSQPELRERLGVNARDFIVNNFSLKQNVLTELKIYNNLLCR